MPRADITVDQANLLHVIEEIANCAMELIIYARGDNTESSVRGAFRKAGEAFIRFAEED